MSDNFAIYQDYLHRAELRLPFCPSCQRYIFYPRGFCPYCWGETVVWKRLQGRGRVYSYTIVNVSALPEFTEKVPYIYAIVELEEGIKMPANIVDCEPEKVTVGMPVELSIQERADVPEPDHTCWRESPMEWHQRL